MTIACALLLLLASQRATPPSAEGAHVRSPGDPAAAAVAEILERIGGPRDVERAGAELARQGTKALEPLFQQLCALSEEPRGIRELVRSAALSASFAHFPREAVLALLTRVARSPEDTRASAAALGVLTLLGQREDIRLALELAVPVEGTSPPAPELRAALERALLGITERDPGALRALAGFFARAHPNAQASILVVLRKSARVDALELLAGLLGQAEGADVHVLLELGRLAALTGGCEDRLVLERVRGNLGHPDKALAIQACIAVERLRDHEGVPDLIVLLGEPDANVRRAAHAALASLTGMPFGPEQGIWIAWLDAGLAWWDERADACRSALVSGSAPEAAAALTEAAGQRLFVDQVVRILALGLARAEPDLVVAACRALGVIEELPARTALAPVLRHRDPVLREGARAALLASAPRSARPSASRSIPVHTRPIRGLQ